MRDIDKDIQELRQRMSDGAIQGAYQEILDYMGRLRVAFIDQRGKSAVSAIYQGRLDVTFFTLQPQALKARNLKLPIVFNYETFCFDTWLTGRNRTVQKHYWQLLLSTGFDKFALIEPSPCEFAIIKETILDDYSLNDQDQVTAQIMEGANRVETDLVAYLDSVDPIN